MATPDKIWLLGVEHKHGTNYSAFTTKEAAKESLWDYADFYWGDYLDDADKPEDHDALVEAYFQAAGFEESYILTEVEVEA